MTNITYGNASSLSSDVLERADRCVHAQVDLSLGVKYSMESDTFGILEVCVQCKTCFEETKRQDRLNHCHYCGAEKETDQWRWYDFYAPQGDVPLEVCSDCWDGPAHQRRISRDNDNYEMDRDYSGND